MGFKQEGQTITLTCTRDDYDLLLIGLGIANGSAMHAGNRALSRTFFGLINRLNEGNPHFRPYEIPPEPVVETGKEAGVEAGKET